MSERVKTYSHFGAPAFIPDRPDPTATNAHRGQPAGGRRSGGSIVAEILEHQPAGGDAVVEAEAFD